MLPRRSLSSSELDLLLRDDTPVIQQLESLQQSARRRTPTRTPTPTQQLQRNISCRGPGDLKDQDSIDPDVIPAIQQGSLIDRHHKIMTEVHGQEGVSTKFPTPPPSFLLPRSRQASPLHSAVVTSTTTKTTITTEKVVSTSRKLPNNISLNTSLINSAHSVSPSKSLSAGSTPVDDQRTFGTIPDTESRITKTNTLTERLSPKSARRKFFELQDTKKYYSDESISKDKNIHSQTLPIRSAVSSDIGNSDKNTSVLPLPHTAIRQSNSLDEEAMKGATPSPSCSDVDSVETKAEKTGKQKRRLFKTVFKRGKHCRDRHSCKCWRLGHITRGAFLNDS